MLSIIATLNEKESFWWNDFNFEARGINDGISSINDERKIHNKEKIEREKQTQEGFQMSSKTNMTSTCHVRVPISRISFPSSSIFSSKWDDPQVKTPSFAIEISFSGERSNIDKSVFLQENKTRARMVSNDAENYRIAPYSTAYGRNIRSPKTI